MTQDSNPAPGASPSPMVCLDIDGTLATPDGSISEPVVTAIGSLHARGVHVVLATGRSLSATRPVLTRLAIDGYAVCSNGALTARVSGAGASTEVVGTRRLDNREAIERFLVEHPGAFVASEGPWDGFRVSREFPSGDLMGRCVVVPPERLVDPDAIRITIRAEHGDAKTLMHQLRARGINSAKYDILGRGWVDISPSGVSKASALESVRVQLGVSRAHTYAAGDQTNDVEMLSWAAHSAAMGGSPPELVAVAQQIVGTVEDDGILDLLRPLLRALVDPVAVLAPDIEVTR